MDKFILDTIFEGDYDRYQIIPLILFTLTENIFKHGNLQDPLNRASLMITIDERGLLTYRSFNVIKGSSNKEKNFNIGINSIRLRLEESYHGRHHLSISSKRYKRTP